jgi:hypothetical protein
MKRLLPALLLACAVAVTGTGVLADPGKDHHNNGRHLGQLRRLQAASLGDSQIAYALGHEQQSIARLRSMRTIDASRVRIIRLTPTQKARFHVSMMSGAVAYEAFTATDSPVVAQIFNTNNPLIQQLQQLIAGILVTNAINNTLGGSTGGGATATLAQILLSNGIPLSSLLGVFFDPSGILNAIVG